jgi:hypothetical protein
MLNTKHYSVRWRWACPGDLEDYDQDKWPALPAWAVGSHPKEDHSGISKAHWDNLPPDVKRSLQDSAKKIPLNTSRTTTRPHLKKTQLPR